MTTGTKEQRDYATNPKPGDVMYNDVFQVAIVYGVSDSTVRLWRRHLGPGDVFYSVWMDRREYARVFGMSLGGMTFVPADDGERMWILDPFDNVLRRALVHRIHGRALALCDNGDVRVVDVERVFQAEKELNHEKQG